MRPRPVPKALANDTGVWKGLVTTLLVAGLIYGLRLSGADIPNPGAVLALAIVYSSFTGGIRAGLTSSGLALVFAAFYFAGGPSSPPRFDPLKSQLVVLSVCFPAIALMVGRLRSQLTESIAHEQSERTRRAAEAKYRRLVDSVKDYAILMLDARGYVRTWNEGAQRIKGYAPDEIIGRHFSTFYPPEDVRAGKTEMELRVASETGRFEDEGWRVRKNGTKFWANVVLTALRDPVTNELEGFVKVSRDLSERRRTENELREKSIALEAANRELEAFSYSVSHDLRSPLRGIDGFSQALMEDYLDRLDEEGRDYIRRIRAGTQRMGRLIDDLLNLSRLTRGELKPQEVNLSALAARILEELRSTEPSRRATLKIEEGLSAHGDPGLLGAALQNLLSNAWKFTSKSRDARIEVGSTNQGGQQVYFVKDNGAGFDMAYADKLFGTFQRLHRADEFAGNGVGLATVRRIIHRHGGKIWVEAGVGKGATFYFTLGMAGTGSGVAGAA